MANLKLRQPLVRVHGFYRPNLSFAAVMEASDRRRLERIMDETDLDGASIVYCSSRKRVDELTGDLQRAGRPAFAYHAGLEADVRENAHRHFRDDARVVIVATNAFGMGVDRPDVRCVIHAQLPGTVEAYYQEAGRAGRDGLAATCLLLHSPGDIAIHEFFNRQSVESVPPEKQEQWQRHRQDQLDLMRRYAYGAGCRQQAIMEYFGDSEKLPTGCGRCDNCQTPEAAPVDGQTQETVRILLSGAARLGGRFGSIQLADLVTGSDTAQIRRYQHEQLPTYGRLSSHVETPGSGTDSGASPSGISPTRGITVSGPGPDRRGQGSHVRSNSRSVRFLAARRTEEVAPTIRRFVEGLRPLNRRKSTRSCARQSAIGGPANRRSWESRRIRFFGTARLMSFAPDARPRCTTW